MTEPYTEDEVRQIFLEQIWFDIDYWNEQSKDTCRERLIGLAFSILNILDGTTISLPGFIVAPLPHKDDREYNIANDERWFPENHNVDINCDIAGTLHELFYKYGR